MPVFRAFTRRADSVFQVLRELSRAPPSAVPSRAATQTELLALRFQLLVNLGHQATTTEYLRA